MTASGPIQRWEAPAWFEKVSLGAETNDYEGKLLSPCVREADSVVNADPLVFQPRQPIAESLQ